MQRLWMGLLGASLCGASPVVGAGWSLEGSLGAAYNFDTRLTIEQEGAEPLTVNARYRTRPFDSPQYYMVRAARRTGDRAWEFSLIHDKLYLRNPPAQVESLSISHGLNVLTVNRAVEKAGVVYRFGGGVIVTHPEGKVRGVEYDGPYDLSGVVLLAGVSKRFYFDSSWFAVGDAAATLGYAKAQARGDPTLTLTVPNAAVHALFGIGRDF